MGCCQGTKQGPTNNLAENLIQDILSTYKLKDYSLTKFLNALDQFLVTETASDGILFKKLSYENFERIVKHYILGKPNSQEETPYSKEFHQLRKELIPKHLEEDTGFSSNFMIWCLGFLNTPDPTATTIELFKKYNKPLILCNFLMFVEKLLEVHLIDHTLNLKRMIMGFEGVINEHRIDETLRENTVILLKKYFKREVIELVKTKIQKDLLSILEEGKFPSIINIWSRKVS